MPLPARNTVCDPRVLRTCHATPTRGAKLSHVVLYSWAPGAPRAYVLGSFTFPSRGYGFTPLSEYGAGSSSHLTPRERLTVGVTCHSSCAKSAKSLYMGIGARVRSKIVLSAE